MFSRRIKEMAFSKKKNPELTPEEKEKRRDHRRQRKFMNNLRKEFVKLVDEHPEIQYKLMEKEFGISLGEYDPVKEGKRKLEMLIVDKAIEAINKDPGLQEELALIYLRNQAGDFGIQVDSPEVQREREMSGFRQTKEIMDMFGIKTNPSWINVVMNSPVIKEAIKAIGQIVAARQASQPSPPHEDYRLYAIEINGELVELTAEEFKAYELIKNKIIPSKNAGTANPTTDTIPIPVPGVDGINISKTDIQPDKNSNN
jgi:hypothetical protein